MPEKTCPNCQGANQGSDVFCIFCGRRLPPQSEAPDEPGGGTVGDGSSQDLPTEIDLLRGQLREAGTLLDRLQERLSQLELRSAAPAAPTPAAQAPEPEAPEVFVPRTVFEHGPTPVEDAGPSGLGVEGPAETLFETRPGPVAAPGEVGVGTAAAPEGRLVFFEDLGLPNLSIDWENLLGRNWFAIIGAVTLVLGIGFFLKLALDNNWIGDTGRVLLGAGLGLALFGTGEYAHRRVPIWAQPVTAGGAAILYLSIYAAFGLYQLIRPDSAFLLLAVVVAVAGVLALRYQSMVIALLGILGAFLSPILLGQDLPDPRLTLVYILVVDLGILGVSTFRNWRWFTLLGWLGSYGLFTHWLIRFPGYEPVLIELALAGIFLVFAGATTLFHVLWRRAPGPQDMGLMALNAMVFFALTVQILWADYEAWFGLIAFALSVFYGLIALAAVKRTGAPPEVSLIALPTAIVFLTVAVPLQLSGVWVPVAWAAQGAVMTWVGFILARWQMRAFGLGALALAVGHLLMFDAWLVWEGFVPVANDRFPVFVAVIVGFYVAGYGYWRNRAEKESWEYNPYRVLWTIAHLLTLSLFSLEVIWYFSGGAVDAGLQANDPTALNGIHLTLTAVWAVYATGLIALGLARRWTVVRWGGLALLGLAVVKLVVLDTPLVELDLAQFTPALNERFLVFAILITSLYALGYYYRRRLRYLDEGEELVIPVLLTAANLLTLLVFSLEAAGYFGSQAVKVGEALWEGTSLHHLLLTLTAVWTVYAFVLVSVGRWRGWRLARAGGIGLLAIAVVKLLVLDTAVVQLDPASFTPVLNERFLVFGMVIAALYGMVYCYRGHQGLEDSWEDYVVAAAAIAASVSTLLLFSLEAVNYFNSREIQAPGSLHDQGVINGIYLTLSAGWAIYAAVLVGVGLAKGWHLVRWGGLALMAGAVFKLLAVDTFVVQLDPFSFVPFLNPHFLALALVAVLLSGLAYWDWRKGIGTGWWYEPLIFRGLVVAANVVAVWGVSFEALHYFGSREVVLGVDNFSAKHLTLTVLWAVYAVGVIGVGIARRSSKIRLAGIALLAVPVIKLFAFDVFLLDRGYRVAAFVTLGALLLGTGLVYQRYNQALRGFLFGAPLEPEESPPA